MIFAYWAIFSAVYTIIRTCLIQTVFVHTCVLIICADKHDIMVMQVQTQYGSCFLFFISYNSKLASKWKKGGKIHLFSLIGVLSNCNETDFSTFRFPFMLIITLRYWNFQNGSKVFMKSKWSLSRKTNKKKWTHFFLIILYKDEFGQSAIITVKQSNYICICIMLLLLIR